MAVLSLVCQGSFRLASLRSARGNRLFSKALAAACLSVVYACWGQGYRCSADGRTQPTPVAAWSCVGPDSRALKPRVDPPPGISRAEDGMTNTDQRSADFLAIAIENAELRQQLADVQDQCVKLAVDAGEQHAENEALRHRLAQAERDRDAWRTEAEQSRRAG